MVPGNAAEAGFVGAMAAVLVISAGTLLFVQGIASEDRTEDRPCPLGAVEGLELSHFPSALELEAWMNETMRDQGWNALGIELRPLLPFGERLVLLVGDPSGTPRGGVGKVMLSSDNGEALPYSLTVRVWEDG